jgi:hypothetical protein
MREGLLLRTDQLANDQGNTRHNRGGTTEADSSEVACSPLVTTAESEVVTQDLAGAPA